MKIMILAAAATITLGIGSAYAQGTGGNGSGAPNGKTTLFDSLPGVVAKPATGSAPTAATTQGTPDGRPVQLYTGQSSASAWLYQPRAATD
jgi:hypothetical protein